MLFVLFAKTVFLLAIIVVAFVSVALPVAVLFEFAFVVGCVGTIADVVVTPLSVDIFLFALIGFPSDVIFVIGAFVATVADSVVDIFLVAPVPFALVTLPPAVAG